MNSYEIVETAVKKFWQETYPQDVVAFFYQKYDYSNHWEWCEELVECCGYDDYVNMEFRTDFCEGQTCVKDLVIVPLDDITKFYIENKIRTSDTYFKTQEGQWIEVPDYATWECSECEEYFCFTEGTPKDNGYYYCPNCGVKMRV